VPSIHNIEVMDMNRILAALVMLVGSIGCINDITCIPKN
jgi:hypothetical protein